MEFFTVVFGSTNKPAGIGIKLATWSRFNHVGVLMPCGKILESTFEDGVVLTEPEDFFARYSKIEFAQVPCINRDIAYEIGYGQVGKKYDWKAIFGIFARVSFHDDSRWFCSELVAAMMGLFRERRISRITPEDIFRLSRTIPNPFRIFTGVKENGVRSSNRHL